MSHQKSQISVANSAATWLIQMTDLLKYSDIKNCIKEPQIPIL